MTRGQSDNNKWKLWRIVIITAPFMKGVCSAQDLLNLHITVFKKICYPMNETVKTKAMKRGTELESTTYATYVAKM